MEWLNDTYTITAGDASAIYCSRGYNLRLGRWETLAGIEMSPSRMDDKLRVRSMDMKIQIAGGRVKQAVHVIGFLVGNPQWTGQVVPWFSGTQSKGRLVQWTGDLPMGAGLLWRVLKGGLDATDIVSIGIGYEHAGGGKWTI